MLLDIISKMRHEITAVSCDDEISLRGSEKAFGAKGYTDHKDLLANEPDIDFAVCCGAHDEEAGMIEELIERGIPFCAEKPITDNADRMLSLVRKIREKKLFSDIILPLRFSPLTLAFQKFREKNHTGEIIHCYFRNMAGGVERYKNWGCGWMLDKSRALGGAFMNEGAHYIDLFRYLTGEEVTAVQAGMSNGVYGGDVDDNLSAILETGSGKRAVIEICYGYPTNSNWRDLAAVINTKKYLFTLIDQETPRVFKLEVRARDTGSAEIIDLLGYEQNVYKVYFGEMFRRFLSGEDGIVPAANFLGTQTTLSKIYISAEGNRKVQRSPFGRDDIISMGDELAGWLLENWAADQAGALRRGACELSYLVPCFMRRYKIFGDRKWFESALSLKDCVLSPQLKSGGFSAVGGGRGGSNRLTSAVSVITENLMEAYNLGLSCDERDLNALSRMADFEFARCKRLKKNKDADLDVSVRHAALTVREIYLFLRGRGRVNQDWLEISTRILELPNPKFAEDRETSRLEKTGKTELNRHLAVIYHLLKSREHETFARRQSIDTALIERARWLVKNILLHTEKGSTPDWPAAGPGFTWIYFVLASEFARAGGIDPRNRRYWHNEAMELMRYVRASLWSISSSSAGRGPVKFSEKKSSGRSSFFTGNPGLCLRCSDRILRETSLGRG
jgi:predicted dehydrogenase